MDVNAINHYMHSTHNIELTGAMQPVGEELINSHDFIAYLNFFFLGTKASTLL